MLDLAADVAAAATEIVAFRALKNRTVLASSEVAHPGTPTSQSSGTRYQHWLAQHKSMGCNSFWGPLKLTIPKVK